MKRAIVTGGAGLIGTSIIEALLKDGWTVASFDIRESRTKAQHIQCDVGDEASVLQAFRQLGWNGLELLVNNAGIAGPNTGPIHELSLSDWRKVTDSHLTGAFLMTRSAVPLMGEGAGIVNMASTRAFMSEPETEAYAASKGGLVALTHALAVSLGPNIRVNAIAPGWITGEADLRKKDNEQHPVGRVGRPQDVADAVVYLAGAGFMTGQVLVLDGGMTKKMIYEE
ncbi:NAD(P)-dependent dehydrogenase (short-subunit alcohol dehydrogenase family) [Rhizobium skierniewicense]|uniref:NAD(P)-dependent dehydrogenase (Short-subunit alcohol dehydrogenase family) n=1 Tax=Rhizobium skierniewicense TaxID=984260 RepID=A0A7W6CCA9_9HYPH|nr:SDR family oxidoreductase [Rhizobium skierniewicense]MBB3945870.1 NAD(P)-dependent dehydrogenase (short-subunit alcohol dehydrogenase family) [Rhizobium skierniewicense]